MSLLKISINSLTSLRKDLTKDEANQIAHKGWKVREFYWFEEDVRYILQCDWMVGLSIDGLKRRTSIYRMENLFLDIDDPTKYGNDLLDHIVQVLTNKGISHAIHTSTNHMKEKVRKSGEILPACPRLKMIIPLSEPVIFDSEADKDDWNYSRFYLVEFLKQLLEVEELDTSSLDVNRASFRMKPTAENFQFSFYKGNPLEIKHLLRKIPPQQPRKYVEMTDEHQQNIINAAYFFFGEHRPRDEWVKVAAAVYHEFGADILKQMTTLTNGELMSFKRQTSNASGAGTIIFFSQQYGWKFPIKQVEQVSKKTSINASISNFNNMWID
ncbi:hypothetical protein ACTTZI_004152 [Vibrio vulnificus]